MTELELKQRIDELLTRVGSNRVDAIDIRTVLKEMVEYTSDNQVAGGGSGTIDEWEDDLTSYDTDELTINNDRIWKSKIDDNIGNEPPQDVNVTEDTNWIEVSKSLNLADWSPGLIGGGLFITFYNDVLYKLTEASRPFESTNIETEITAGQWRPISGMAIKEETGATFNAKFRQATIYKGTVASAGTLPLGTDAMKGEKIPVYHESANDVVITMGGSGGQTVKYPDMYQGDRREYMWTGSEWL